jgi:hypothetical protein
MRPGWPAGRFANAHPVFCRLACCCLTLQESISHMSEKASEISRDLSILPEQNDSQPTSKQAVEILAPTLSVVDGHPGEAKAAAQTNNRPNTLTTLLSRADTTAPQALSQVQGNAAPDAETDPIAWIRQHVRNSFFLRCDTEIEGRVLVQELLPLVAEAKRPKDFFKGTAPLKKQDIREINLRRIELLSLQDTARDEPQNIDANDERWQDARGKALAALEALGKEYKDLLEGMRKYKNDVKAQKCLKELGGICCRACRKARRSA